ncbi:uncharacterized protein GGS22DRAFT_83984 [Annulohypoxylon maeteangense]|uniref:uncharacterized protein n=1 Tax=Annulohypoxylon maeteangense TaxID=1927788 RepID=UPI002008389D|nr:uncharacterized protein GGS22DRAFT_83984 [Annulohypoxylon maeteangense]KAI0880444.1 hypothetical protein GGS22DRAFT_83984 [Annulohypoxylon maeteangense]
MPFIPGDNGIADSRVASGNTGPTSSRKRVRDSDCEAPRAKVAKTGQEDDKLADLKSSLANAATILDAAMSEIRETKADIKQRKIHLKGLIAEFHDVTAMVTERSVAYMASLREEKLKKENASLRDRIKRLEEASPDEIKREIDQESRSRRRAKSYGCKASIDDPDVNDKAPKQGE